MKALRYILVGLIVAAIAVGVLLYIGWFDDRTHVDSPNGDNVTEQYQQPDSTPATNAWENTAGQSLDSVITAPATPSATPAGSNPAQ